MKYKTELEFAIKAAYLAGDKIMEVYKKDFSVCYKADDSPVTDADIAANNVIIEILSQAFPNDGFLSEEVSDDKSRFTKERFWIIDPLDGTKEFVKKNGEFAVNIGLVKNGEILIGVVYLPVKRKLYYGSLGEGSFTRNRDEESKDTKRLHVSERHNDYHLLISRSHPSKKTLKLIELKKPNILSVNKMGSSIKGCMIAEGIFDVYYNFGHSMKWDTCAMEILVKEAGGILKRLDDQDIDYEEVEMLNRGFYILNNANNHVDLSKLTN